MSPLKRLYAHIAATRASLAGSGLRGFLALGRILPEYSLAVSWQIVNFAEVMANTYTGIFVHLVFASKHREASIVSVYRERIYRYMKQVIRELGHVPLAIGGTDDHVHILVGYNVNQLLPDMVRTLKSHTTRFINTELVLSRRFEWQRGYAALSNSRKELDAVKNYIAHQSEHHKGMTLNDEVRLMLDRCGIPYDNRYLFDDV